MTALDNLKENRKLQPQGNGRKNNIKVPSHKRQSSKDRKSILTEKGFQGFQLVENEKPINGRKSVNGQNSKSENVTKPNDEIARKSTNKVKPSKFDEAEKLKSMKKCMKNYESLKSILSEKGIKSRKPFEYGRPKTTLFPKKSIRRQNSKSEKEFKEYSAPKGKIDCADHESISLKRKKAFNDTTSNKKKPRNCEKSVNDEKLTCAEKSTAKKKPNKVDKSANPKQLDDAEKSTSGQKSTIKEKTTKIVKAEILKESNKDEKSTSGQKSINELMSEVVESSGKFFCPENCGKSFDTIWPLRKHLLSHRPEHEWPYVCLFCGQHSQARADLPKHFKSSKHINDFRIPKQGTPAWEDLMAKSVNTI